MYSLSFEQLRNYRLRTHHLDRWYEKDTAATIADVCGLQNTPPGAWEAAMQSRIFGFSSADAKQLLELDKVLLQAWSFRGAPVVFPRAAAGSFLAALAAAPEEPWVYTRGILLALDFLKLSFDEALRLLLVVLPQLEGKTIKSKAALDRFLAEQMLPLLPEAMRPLWLSPSMYGRPDVQIVGDSVVSFLLRPAAFLGHVVFGARQGASPTFTTPHTWLGSELPMEPDAPGLVLRYLHAYGPATPRMFADWLGCSPQQAARLWATAVSQMVPVLVEGHERFMAADQAEAMQPAELERRFHMLSGHDPYLGLQDREVILANTARQREVWQLTTNPGVFLANGLVVGLWRSRRQGKALDVTATLWDDSLLTRKAAGFLIEQTANAKKLRLKQVLWQA